MIEAQMKQRRGTAAEWTATDPILAEGELGIETDTLVMKIGNGVSKWSVLQPGPGAPGGSLVGNPSGMTLINSGSYNRVLRAGLYNCNNLTDGPSGYLPTRWTYLQVFAHVYDATRWMRQVLWDMSGTTDEVWTRRIQSADATVGANWTPWVQVGATGGGAIPDTTVAEGVNGVIYGDSYYVAAEVMNSTAKTRVAERLLSRVRFNGLTNFAISGTATEDSLHYMLAQGAYNWPGNGKGLVIVSASMNDIFYGGGAPDNLFKDAVEINLRGIVAVLSSAGRTEDSSGIFSYSGGWSSVNSSTSSGPTSRFTQTSGATVTFNAPAADIGIMTSTLREDTYDNMIITVSQGGVTKAAWDLTSKQFTHANAGDAKNKLFRVRNLTAGQSTVITYTAPGRTNFFGYFDGIMTFMANPPSILLVKPGQVTPSAYPQYNNTTKRDLLRAAVDTIVGEHTNVFSADWSTGWDPLGMTGSDQLHPNDKGTAHVARAIERAIATMPFRQGMHNITV